MDNKELTVKHLELIQSVINRLANNSFLIKGWTITLALAFFALIEKNVLPRNFLFVFTSALIIFWILDSYYLKRERLFRKLFDEVASNINAKNHSDFFKMDTSSINIDFLEVLFSFPNSLIYISLLTLAFLTYCQHFI